MRPATLALPPHPAPPLPPLALVLLLLLPLLAPCWGSRHPHQNPHHTRWGSVGEEKSAGVALPRSGSGSDVDGSGDSLAGGCSGYGTGARSGGGGERCLPSARAPDGKHFAWKSTWQQGRRVTVLTIEPDALRGRRSPARHNATRHVGGHGIRHRHGMTGGSHSNGGNNSKTGHHNSSNRINNTSDNINSYDAYNRNIRNLHQNNDDQNGRSSSVNRNSDNSIEWSNNNKNRDDNRNRDAVGGSTPLQKERQRSNTSIRTGRDKTTITVEEDEGISETGDALLVRGVLNHHYGAGDDDYLSDVNNGNDVHSVHDRSNDASQKPGYYREHEMRYERLGPADGGDRFQANKISQSKLFSHSKRRRNNGNDGGAAAGGSAERGLLRPSFVVGDDDEPAESKEHEKYVNYYRSNKGKHGLRILNQGLEERESSEDALDRLALIRARRDDGLKSKEREIEISNRRRERRKMRMEKRRERRRERWKKRRRNNSSDIVQSDGRVELTDVESTNRLVSVSNWVWDTPSGAPSNSNEGVAGNSNTNTTDGSNGVNRKKGSRRRGRGKVGIPRGEGGGNSTNEEKRRKRIARRRKRRRERRMRRRERRKRGRSLSFEQNNKSMLHGSNACQYRDLVACARETGIVRSANSSGPAPGDTIPRCMQRKSFLSCMQRQRSGRGDCGPAAKALGDLQGIRKHIRSAMFTNSSCIIAESITG